ncbi:MAG: NADAR family protein [Blautia sp.]
MKGLSAKFSQSEELKELLLGTGDYTLAEFAKRDRIYGIGMDDSDYYRFDPSKWYGTEFIRKSFDAGARTACREVKM